VREGFEVLLCEWLIGSCDIDSEMEDSLSLAAARCFSSSEVTRFWMISSMFLARVESV